MNLFGDARLVLPVNSVNDPVKDKISEANRLQRRCPDVHLESFSGATCQPGE